MCTQSIEWNLLLFGLLHSNVSNFYSRYWVWFTHDWHFILLNMCSHCGFNVLLNIFSWAYSTFFAVYNGLSHSCSLKKTLEKPLRNPLTSSVCKFVMFGIYLISRDQYLFYIIKDLQKDFYVQSNVHLDCKYNMNFVFTQYLISTTVCVETWYSIGDNQTFPL